MFYTYLLLLKHHPHLDKQTNNENDFYLIHFK
jgi:hypothetical protein